MGLPNSLHILLREDNVVIPSARIFCHWVLDMNVAHLSLDCFPRDLYDPPTTGPLMIVLISPKIGLRLSQTSSLWSSIGFSSARWGA